MNSAIMHTYVMRHELNQEYQIYNQFLVSIGMRKDDNIDAIILIDGEQGEESEWKGLTQTMKKVFVKELDTTKTFVKKEVDSVKKEVDSLREEMKVQSLKLDKITSLIEQNKM